MFLFFLKFKGYPSKYFQLILINIFLIKISDDFTVGIIEKFLCDRRKNKERVIL